MAEQRHHPVAKLLGDLATHFRHRRRSRVEISSNQVAPFLSIEPRGNASRIHQIAEHYRDMAALGGVMGLRLRWREGYRSGSFGRRNEGGDRLQQFLAMAERRDADVLEIVVCQPGQQLAVDVVGAEHLCILGETDPAKPTFDLQVQSPGLCQRQLLKRG
jgi:hypothetical protein